VYSALLTHSVCVCERVVCVCVSMLCVCVCVYVKGMPLFSGQYSDLFLELF